MKTSLTNFSFTELLRIACIPVLALFLLTACNKSPEHANYIPKDANLVVTVDVKSLGLKSMGFKDVFSMRNLKNLLSKNVSKDSSLNIANSGIDLLNNAYVFGSYNESNQGYGAVILALSNEAKFGEFSKKLFKQITITTEGENKIATSPEEPNAVIIWNNSTAVLCFQKESKENISVTDKALSILNLKKDESLALSNKNFENFLKESSDLALWVNFEKAGSIAKKYSGATALSDWKDNYLTMTCNFDKGQIEIKSKYFANKDVSEKLDFAKASISKETASLVPGESLVGFLGISLDMTKLYNLLEKEQAIAMVDGQISQTTGMATKDLFQLFNGEIVASYNGMVEQEVKAYDFTTGKEEVRKELKPDFTVIFGVNDKEKSAQLLSSLTSKGLLTKEENAYSIRSLYSILDQGSHLVLIPESQKQIFTSRSNKLTSQQEQLLTSNSASLFMDFTKISDNSLETLSPYQKALIKNSPIETVVVSSEPMKDKISNGKCIITLKEKEQNSIVTLAKVSEELSKKSEEEELLPTEQNLEVPAEAPIEEEVTQ